MATRRRRIAAVAVAGIVLATGTGAAYAYFTPAQKPLADPANYFTYCADRQRDVAGITPADLTGANNGGHDYTIENFIHVGNRLASRPYDELDPFVVGKSGIAYAPVGAAPPAVPEQDYDRRILTAQVVEYDANGMPVQVRCKMRTRESLNRPESQKQRFGGPSSTQFSSVPWGFGPGTASGTPKVCRDVQSDIASDVWNGLTPAERSAAVYRWAEVDGNPANVTVAPEILPENITPTTPFGDVFPDTNVFIGGNQWTSGYDNGIPGYQPGDGFDSVRIKDGGLELRSAALDAASDNPLNPIGDRIAGAYYCTFTTAEYLKAVYLGQVVPPAAVS